MAQKHSCGCGHHHEEETENCGCGHHHEEETENCGCGHHHEEEPYLLLDAQREVSLNGMIGALVDLGIVPFPKMMTAYKSLKLDVEPEFCVDMKRGCRGVHVRIQEGKKETKENLFAHLAGLDNAYGACCELLTTIYQVVDAVCSDEQNAGQPDLGRFLRTDVFGLLFLGCMMIADGTSGLVATTLELGNGEYQEEQCVLSVPASLVTRMLEGMIVTSTSGLRGIDVPSAALVSGSLVGQIESVKGILGACGFGLDDTTVTRIYLVQNHD